MTHIYLTTELALEAGQDDKLATQFKGVAYSGGRAQPHNAVIDLATLKLSTDMPLLAGHDHGAVIGNITQAAKDGGQVSVTGDIYSDIDDTAAGIVKKAARGSKYQMSVGVFDFSDEYLPEGQSIEVNGQTFNGPVMVLRNGLLREVSIVPLGADSHTSAEFFSANRIDHSNQGGHMATLEELEAKVAELTGELSAEKTARETAETARAELAAKADAERKAARTAAVKALFEATGRDYSDDKAKAYMSMEQAEFDAVCADMKALQEKLPEGLFQAHQPEGQHQAKKGVLLSVVENRFGAK